MGNEAVDQLVKFNRALKVVDGGQMVALHSIWCVAGAES